jgi:hypothetical protein
LNTLMLYYYALDLIVLHGRKIWKFQFTIIIICGRRCES